MTKAARSFFLGPYVLFWLLFSLGLVGVVFSGYLSSRHPPIVANPMEQERLRVEAAVEPQTIKVTTDFNGAQSLPVREISPTHFLIEIGNEDSMNWFMFRIEGAAGQDVRIDVRRARRRLSWSILNPVYCYADKDELADPDLFSSESTAGKTLLTKASNGSMLPETEGKQRWHFIENSWFNDQTLSFTQHFDRSPVIVAMKYPLTPALNDRFLKEAAKSPHVKIIEVGQSQQGRPLHVVEIGSVNEEKDKPCIVVTARELGNQQDAGWVAWGMIDYLTSDDPDAVRARNAFVFSIVPLVDPDSAIAGRWDPAMESVLSHGNDRPEPRLYAAYFNARRDAGHPIRLALSLRSTESADPYHFDAVALPPERARRENVFHGVLTEQMAASGLWVSPSPERRGATLNDFPEWFLTRHRALSLAYHINSQCSAGHMTLEQLQEGGARFMDAACAYLMSDRSDHAAAIRAAVID